MEDEPINQNYLIGCDAIENSPSFLCLPHDWAANIQTKFSKQNYFAKYI